MIALLDTEAQAQAKPAVAADVLGGYSKGGSGRHACRAENRGRKTRWIQRQSAEAGVMVGY
ncbi:MAG: hypothetical protein WDM70_00810 [Nitrosomonadales bacterium]